MEFPAERRVASVQKLEEIARDFCAALKPGSAIGLIGALGAGKTAFVRACAHVLGSNDEITSPTYTLEHRYPLPEGRILSHWDLYRVRAAPRELYEGIENAFVFVEWSDRDIELQDTMDFVISIEVLSETERAFLFQRAHR